MGNKILESNTVTIINDTDFLNFVTAIGNKKVTKLIFSLRKDCLFKLPPGKNMHTVLSLLNAPTLMSAPPGFFEEKKMLKKKCKTKTKKWGKKKKKNLFL